MKQGLSSSGVFAVLSRPQLGAQAPAVGTFGPGLPQVPQQCVTSRPCTGSASALQRRGLCGGGGSRTGLSQPLGWRRAPLRVPDSSSFPDLLLQNMAPGAEEAPLESGSATTAGKSQRQWEAVAAGLCPICLDSMDDTAHVIPCLHTFCFGCIRQWAAVRGVCPLCRQHFGRILHTVRADDDYQEYMVPSSSRQQSPAAGQRVRSRSPQWRYHLRPRPNNNPTAGRRGPAERDQGRAPRNSDTSTP
ncbi:E3 ubiquitin-protein ligase Topors-like isoform X2 [Empidonax traillii]|uniref:E3 ubiquitin-protein ligase Topors-like isoform X2 n=1 Tax=Empidonax traillii TaxID=164674 RepID=UPI000FFD6F95|nr:E3 ubiquitin-protein ligase Topors-like isoform X2 [Empidonax traillii]